MAARADDAARFAGSQYLDRRDRAYKPFPCFRDSVCVDRRGSPLSHWRLRRGLGRYVSLGSVTSAPLVQPIYPFQWGLPQFTPGFIVGMFAGMLASLSRVSATTTPLPALLAAARRQRRINHGIGMEGAMNVFSAVMGGSGSTSYSENIGAIGLTGVASRYVVQVGAVVMLVMGFVGYFGQLIATIPDPIVGGLYVAMFGQIVAVGLSNLKYVDLDSSRNVFIVGVAMFAGLAVPAYMGNVGRERCGGATAIQQGLRLSRCGERPRDRGGRDHVVRHGRDRVVVGGIVAFVLDNTVPGTREERGLAAWAALTEDDSVRLSARPDRGRGGDRPSAVSDD